MGYVPLADEERIARKPHRCIWCGESIARAEKYHYASGIFQSDFQDNHWHLECFGAMQREVDQADYYDPNDGFDAYMHRRGMTEDETDEVGRQEQMEGVESENGV